MGRNSTKNSHFESFVRGFHRGGGSVLSIFGLVLFVSVPAHVGFYAISGPGEMCAQLSHGFEKSGGTELENSLRIL